MTKLSESTRVEAFSDGVLAIAITLLVLDLHSDYERGRFLAGLGEQWPGYVAYLAAFLNIAAIWINHHDLFTRVRQVDVRLICTNLFLLLVASLFPWPAAVIASAVRDGSHDDEVAAAVLYAGVGFLVPVAWILLYGYVARSRPNLTDAAGAQYARAGIRRSVVSLVVYPLAAALAFVLPVAALIAFVALPLFFIVSLLYSEREPASEPAREG
jgi:uncharacterized membrane protein